MVHTEASTQPTITKKGKYQPLHQPRPQQNEEWPNAIEIVDCEAKQLNPEFAMSYARIRVDGLSWQHNADSEMSEKRKLFPGEPPQRDTFGVEKRVKQKLTEIHLLARMTQNIDNMESRQCQVC
ncbi:hypothetical protein RRG08_007517 [Elysia crispata]|uniref:Uncharacterized protein n=1 Tax=Elysia crispata TaxID=231223 RepID=A0AAE1DNM6_9GAST|nr:hypothetical protein RRG08_007517 [Elysia crispata]